MHGEYAFLCDWVRFMLLCEQQTNDFSQIRIHLAKSKAKKKQLKEKGKRMKAAKGKTKHEQSSF